MRGKYKYKLGFSTLPRNQSHWRVFFMERLLCTAYATSHLYFFTLYRGRKGTRIGTVRTYS